MPVLTVFLAPTGPAGGILDVLQDLSAAHLVDPFLWVPEAAVSTHTVGAVAVQEGRQRITSVGEAVADQQYERVRLCVLVPLLGSAATVVGDVEQRVVRLLETTAGGAAVTRIRCLLTRPGSSTDSAAAAREGWHNVLIAPEDSRGPGLGNPMLPPSVDPVDVGRHAAPAVAGVVGLWSGMAHCDLDGLRRPPEEWVRVARCFYRRVDAGAVEQELRARVLATRPALPRPRDHGASAVYVEHVGLACRDMAARLWRKYGYVLRAPRAEITARDPQPLGWQESIKLLLGFLVSALRQAPQDWIDRTKTRIAGGFALRVHTSVFGLHKDPAYEVVVNGVSRNGLPAGWQEIGEASERLDGDLFTVAASGEHRVSPDLSALWTDFAGGAMTLADAGTRGGADMPPVRIDQYQGVLRSVADCAPGPHDDFTDIPAHLVARPGPETRRVQAGDVLGAQTLRGWLQQHTLEPARSQDPARSQEADRTVQALDAWTVRHAGTYAGQVGVTLGRQLQNTAGEVSHNLQRLREAGAPTDPDEPELDRRRAMARGLRILSVIALLAFIALGVLYGYGIVTIGRALLLGLIVVVLWIGLSVRLFLRTAQKLFHELNRLRALLSEAEVAEKNLQYALADLRRLSHAYRQFLLWTRVVGVVLRDPFGPVTPAGATGAHIVRGLPRTTKVARALVDESVMAEVSSTLRLDLFTPGWLSGPWESTLAGAGKQLGPRGFELREDPEALFTLQGGGVEGSLLQQWSELLAEQGTTADVGDAAWSTVMGSINDAGGRRAYLSDQLLSSVQGVDQADRPAVALADFLSGVDRSDAVAREQRFDSGHFTAEAQTRDRARIAISDPVLNGIGLSRIAVLVQFSEARPVYDLAFGPTPEPTPPPPPAPPPAWPEPDEPADVNVLPPSHPVF